MMNKNALLMVAIIIVLLLNLQGAGAFCAQSDIYQRGLQEKQHGQWRDALRIWASAADSAAEEHSPDPRIGFAFIELATENEADSLYQQANDLYFWGLGAGESKTVRQALAEEVVRMAPLLRKRKRERWEKLLHENLPLLSREMKAFWIKKDVIPTTRINERLLEHWRRIAFARKNFTLREEPPYGTDVRGLVLVKFGSPDKTVKRKLGLDQQAIIRWLDDFLLRQEVQRYNNTPDVEVWLYGNPDHREPTIFMFGKKAGAGRYGLQHGVEAFIPERAFSRRNTKTTAGLLPGTMLQLMYYLELVDVDDFFLDRYRSLEARWGNARAAGQLNPNNDVLLGLLNHFKSQDKRKIEFENLETDRTNVLEGLERLFLNVKWFRYLDVRGAPRIALFAVSGNRPIEAAHAPQFFRTAVKTKFKNRHVFIEFDANWQRQNETVVYPAVHNSTTSVLKDAHDSMRHYVVAAEKVILDVRKQALLQADLPDTAKVIGINSAVLESLSCLHHDSTTFDVSDLLVGVDIRPDVAETFDYPFPVMVLDPLRNSQPMRVYFEAYHLQAGKRSERILELSWRLYELQSDRGDKKKSRRQKKFKVESPRPTLKKTISLDLTGLKEGQYELEIIFKDKAANRKISRNTTFYLAESL